MFAQFYLLPELLRRQWWAPLKRSGLIIRFEPGQSPEQNTGGYVEADGIAVQLEIDEEPYLGELTAAFILPLWRQGVVRALGGMVARTLLASGAQSEDWPVCKRLYRGSHAVVSEWASVLSAEGFRVEIVQRAAEVGDERPPDLAGIIHHPHFAIRVFSGTALCPLTAHQAGYLALDHRVLNPLGAHQRFLREVNQALVAHGADPVSLARL
jgi:hypothetical protein